MMMLQPTSRRFERREDHLKALCGVWLNTFPYFCWFVQYRDGKRHAGGSKVSAKEETVNPMFSALCILSPYAVEITDTDLPWSISFLFFSDAVMVGINPTSSIGISLHFSGEKMRQVDKKIFRQLLQWIARTCLASQIQVSQFLWDGRSELEVEGCVVLCYD